MEESPERSVFEHVNILRALASQPASSAVGSRPFLEQIDATPAPATAKEQHAVRLPRLVQSPPVVETPEDQTAGAVNGVSLRARRSRDESGAQEDRRIPRQLPEQLDSLADELARAAPETPEALDGLHPNRRLSGCNLLHYLALRRCETLPLPSQLGERGLASFGLAEAHVATSLHAVRSMLHRSMGRVAPPLRGPAPGFAQGLGLLADATAWLLGPAPQDRRTRIMVTVYADEAKGSLIKRLIESGMSCMRINCAHNGPEQWLALVRQLRAAEKELGRSCKILMDVSGPKPRTGPLVLGPPMVKWRPARNRLGQLVRPAIIALAPLDIPLPEDLGADAVLRLPAEFLEELRPREELKLKDARGVPRRLIVWAKRGAVWLAEGHSTSYVTDGISLRAKRSGSKAQIRGLPAAEEPILLEVGDALRLTKSLKPGRGAIRDYSGRLAQPAEIGCTLGEGFWQLRAGQRALLDDGKIECVIRRVDSDGALVDVVQAPAGGAKLRSNRSVNFPDSRLRLPALTAKDFKDLSFIAQHADLVGFSFVQRPDDVFQLQEHLSRLGKPQMGIVLKIETRRSFENLPALLWAAMRSEAAGVMIARGDLAVECGYEGLAQMQEEILRLCQAAHLPVIWATQVLENLAKRGVPTRAEITDAAMSERAECVMLNKGPHIEKAVTALAAILSRWQPHDGSTPMPRQLQSWERPPWP